MSGIELGKDQSAEAAAVAKASGDSPPPNKEKDKEVCEVCKEGEVKYCCPRCSIKTCSLVCVKEHKEKKNCSGKRDRSAFVGRGQLDERSLLSDYRFLEEVKLADDVAKRSRPPAPKAELPSFLQSLVHQARRRGVQLHLLPPGMERRKINSTRYDSRQQLLSWRVEWQFAAANCTTANTRVSERDALREILSAHLTPPPGSSLKSPELQRYSDCRVEVLVVAMRKERTPANAPLYYRIDLERPLGESLRGKVVVEFPVLMVLLPEEVEGLTFEKEDVGGGGGGYGEGAGVEVEAKQEEGVELGATTDVS